jgi:hypothetical protein
VDDDDVAAEREESAVYAIIAIAVAPVIVAVAIQGGVIDSGATLCMLVAVIGILGLIWRRRSSFPRARIHRATPRKSQD